MERVVFHQKLLNHDNTYEPMGPSQQTKTSCNSIQTLVPHKYQSLAQVIHKDKKALPEQVKA